MDKKQIKKEYQKTVQPMGVYRIVNMVTGKILIGSSKNLPAIANRVKLQLKLGSYPNQELQLDYTQFGEAAFRFEVVDYLQPNDRENYDYSGDLRELEDLWLDQLQPYGDKGYNKPKSPR